MAKVCHVEKVPELSSVFGEKLESYKKPKEAELLLKKHKAWDDIIKVHVSLRMRAGKSRGETDVIASAGDLASSTVKAVASSKSPEVSLVLLCIM